MALAYNVWTDKQIEERNVSPDGDYPFEITAAVAKKTQGGRDKDGNIKPIRDMLEIDFVYWNIDGVLKKCKDWIVFMENMDWKLRHLANTTNLLDLYDAHTLDAHHLLGKKGSFTLGTKEMVGKDGTPRKLNFVRDYVKKNYAAKDVATNQGSDFVDDDIPASFA